MNDWLIQQGIGNPQMGLMLGLLLGLLLAVVSAWVASRRSGRAERWGAFSPRSTPWKLVLSRLHRYWLNRNRKTQFCIRGLKTASNITRSRSASWKRRKSACEKTSSAWLEKSSKTARKNSPS